MYNISNELVNCITIKVEPEVRKDDYNRKYNALNYGYNYTVREEEAANAMIFIENLYKQCGIPCERIYPVSFGNIPKSNIWTKQRIIDQVVREAKRLGTLQQETIKISK